MGLAGVLAGQLLQTVEGRLVQRNAWLLSLVRVGSDRQAYESSCLLLLGVVVAALLAGSVPVAASTTVSGVGDPSSPLIVDPGSVAGGAADDTVTIYSGEAVAYITDMPDTRDVSTVKLGAFAKYGCTGDVAIRLKVQEAKSTAIEPSEAISQSMDGTGSLDPVLLPSTPENLTFHMSPFTMHQGYSYTFIIYTDGACGSAERITWPHNDTALTGGSADLCPAIENGLWQRRGWHVQGGDDMPTCLNAPDNFDPTMPSGWLVWSYGYVPTALSPPPPNPPPTPCTFDSETHYVDWKPSYVEGQDVWVCAYSPFSAPGTTVADGWYTAGGWEALGNGPADAYIELDPLDSQDLLDTYAPELAFNTSEDFLPQDAGAFTNNSAEGNSPYATANANRLWGAGSTLLAAGGSPGTGTLPPALSLATLGASYDLPGDPVASSSDYIDAHGSSVATAHTDAAYQRTQGFDDAIYGRFVQDPDDHADWLQYWFFYYYNSFDDAGFGLHEGDWEMMQIRLYPSVAGGMAPDETTFSVHDSAGRGCGWGQITTADRTPGDHILVYPGRGSHATYPYPGDSDIVIQGVDTLLQDFHNGDGTVKDPPVQVVGTQSWWEWPGRWGSSAGVLASPSAPSQQGSKWTSPSEFDTNSDHDHCTSG